MTGIELAPPAAPPVVRFPSRLAPRTGSPRSPGALSASSELDLEVARLLRVRSGELAEPLTWTRPSYRRQVEEYVGQLAPIRSRLALLSSWERESRRDGPLRLAYAIAWLNLARRRAGEYGPRASARSRAATRLTGRG